MNIQDRIAKLETQICQSIDELTKLKEEVSLEKVDDSWMPRKGEIIRVTDNKEDWAYTRFAEYKKDYYYDDNGDFWMYAEPLNDPMVIQLIPHVPGDPRPSGDANKVVVVFESGEYDTQSPYELDWGDDNEEGNIVGWLDVT